MRPTVEQLESRDCQSASAPDFLHVDDLDTALQSWDEVSVLVSGPVEVRDFGHPGWDVGDPAFGDYVFVCPSVVNGVWCVFTDMNTETTYVRLNLTQVQTVGLLLSQSGLSLLVQQQGRIVHSVSFDGGDSWGAWQTVAEWTTLPVGGPAPAGAALPFWAVGGMDVGNPPQHVGTFAATPTMEGVELRWAWLDNDEVVQAAVLFRADGTLSDVESEEVDVDVDPFETQADYLWS